MTALLLGWLWAAPAWAVCDTDDTDAADTDTFLMDCAPEDAQLGGGSCGGSRTIVLPLALMFLRARKR